MNVNKVFNFSFSFAPSILDPADVKEVYDAVPVAAEEEEDGEEAEKEKQKKEKGKGKKKEKGKGKEKRESKEAKKAKKKKKKKDLDVSAPGFSRQKSETVFFGGAHAATLDRTSVIRGHRKKNFMFPLGSGCEAC